MEWPWVSIVIVNWNGYDDTAECLESIRHISYPSYDVIVIDNNSQGNDAAMLESRFEHYAKVVAADENYGFAGGSNIGIRLALENLDAAYILLLNNDTVVDTDFLTEMVKVAKTDNNIGLTGSLVLEDSGKVQYAGQDISWCGGALFQRRAELSEDMVVDAGFVPGSCMLIRREVLEEVGLLSVEYFLECEDTDYCIRVSRSGFRIVCVRTAKVWHKVSRSVYKVSSLFVRYYARNRIVVRAKYASLSQFLCFLLNFMFVQAWIYLFLYLVRWRRLDIVSSFFTGVWEGFSIGQRYLRQRFSVFLQNAW
jgi:GT2 family glycosyltransferase